MRFSICVMADVDEIGFFSHAEALGYDSVWVTDSQMLFSDCYAVLALAAQQTRRIRLGPGVAICGTRIPPVHVAAMATLNRIAPGRVHLGVGTGNTATRSMGQPPMRIAEYAHHLRVLRGLLRGDAVDYAQQGAPRPIKMLIREKKYMSLEPRIPLYVSAFGPRAMELAGEYGDGVVFAIPPRGIAPDQALEHCRAGAARAGRRLDESFHTCALANVVLLDPGEPANENLYELSAKEIRRRRIGLLPQNLSEAMDALDADEVVKSGLGADLAKEFIELKRMEWVEYSRHVSDWETARYVEMF